MRSCERCGAAREDTSRFCAKCGLDFWQAAAGGDQGATGTSRAAAAPGSPAAPAAGWSSASILAIAAGIVLLAGAGGLWLALNLISPSASPSGPRRLTEAPATHPIVLSFFSEARDPEAAFAWTQEGEVLITGLGEELTTVLSTEGRMAGEDWIAAMTVNEDGISAFSGEVAVVDQRVYARTGDADWTEGERFPRAALGPVNPFARITTVGELEYVGPDTRNGRDGHLLRTEKWLSDPELVEPIRRIAHERSREALMEIHVASDGVPLSAVYTFALEARTPDGEIVTLEGRSTYTFTDWGSVEPVIAPS